MKIFFHLEQKQDVMFSDLLNQNSIVTLIFVSYKNNIQQTAK